MQFAVRSAEDLGRAIRRVRRDRGWTQQDLGLRTGADRRYVAKIERGRSSRLLDLVLDLLRVLDLEITLSVHARASHDQPEDTGGWKLPSTLLKIDRWTSTTTANSRWLAP